MTLPTSIVPPNWTESPHCVGWIKTIECCGIGVGFGRWKRPKWIEVKVEVGMGAPATLIRDKDMEI